MTEFTASRNAGWRDSPAALPRSRRRAAAVRAAGCNQPIRARPQHTRAGIARFSSGGKLVAEERPSASSISARVRWARSSNAPIRPFSQWHRRSSLTKYHDFLRRRRPRIRHVRLRIPQRILNARQMPRAATIGLLRRRLWRRPHARHLQVREIPANHAVDLLLSCRRSGSPRRLRAPTLSATSTVHPDRRSIDPRTDRHAPRAAPCITTFNNHREMFGLPRTFNIAFGTAAASARCSRTEITNDIALRLPREPRTASISRLRSAASPVSRLAHETALLKPEDA